MGNQIVRTPEELARILKRTEAKAMAEYMALRQLDQEPAEVEYNYAGFGYEEKPPFGWGQ